MCRGSRKKLCRQPNFLKTRNNTCIQSCSQMMYNLATFRRTSTGRKERILSRECFFQGKLTKTAMSVECLIYSRKSIDIEDFERRREVLKVKRRSERKYSENRSEDFWHRREKSSSFPPSLSRPLKQASNPSVNSKLFRLNQLQQRNVQPTANDKTDTSFQRNRLWIGSSWKDEISAVGQDGERVLRLTRRSVRR